MTYITILGSGAWGTALGQVLVQHNPVTIWGRNPEKINQYQTTQTHEGLQDVSVSKNLNWTSDIHKALPGPLRGQSHFLCSRRNLRQHRTN